VLPPCHRFWTAQSSMHTQKSPLHRSTFAPGFTALRRLSRSYGTVVGIPPKNLSRNSLPQRRKVSWGAQPTARRRPCARKRLVGKKTARPTNAVVSARHSEAQFYMCQTLYNIGAAGLCSGAESKAVSALADAHLATALQNLSSNSSSRKH